MKITGKNVVYEAIKNGVEIKEAYVTKETLKIVNKLDPRKIKVVEKKVIDKLFGSNHQNIGAYINDFVYMEIEELLNKEPELLLILDNIEDPHNLGAIIRSAEACGVSAIILPKDRSATVNQTVVKISTGAIFNLDIVQVNNINRTIDKLKENGIVVIGTDASAENIYTDISYIEKTAIVIGSEGKGIRKMVRKNCDTLVKIPMNGSVNSLNASVSAALLVYEVLRQRNK